MGAGVEGGEMMGLERGILEFYYILGLRDILIGIRAGLSFAILHCT